MGTRNSKNTEDSQKQEFWQEQATVDRTEIRKQVVRSSLIFALLFAGIVFAIWWTSSAVHFGASRMDETTKPSYKVSGIVSDARTGARIPWAEISDDPAGRPPFFHTTADRFGAYELLTIAEPHQLRITALGYHAASVRAGRQWYIWMPSGSEKLDIKLVP